MDFRDPETNFLPKVYVAQLCYDIKKTSGMNHYYKICCLFARNVKLVLSKTFKTQNNFLNIIFAKHSD